MKNTEIFFSGFNFKTENDRRNAEALLVSCMIRHRIGGKIPLFIIEGEGCSGKSTLIRGAAALSGMDEILYISGSAKSLKDTFCRTTKPQKGIFLLDTAINNKNTEKILALITDGRILTGKTETRQIDLSNVVFVATARDLKHVSECLLSRGLIIQLDKLSLYKPLSTILTEVSEQKVIAKYYQKIGKWYASSQPAAAEYILPRFPEWSKTIFGILETRI
ncbi:hypothetical protein KA977_06065 [Candidatus Dependentiae bacterium]|nr:hypothetical protein [Candidatus Dependentiae bacterium]